MSRHCKFIGVACRHARVNWYSVNLLLFATIGATCFQFLHSNLDKVLLVLVDAAIIVMLTVPVNKKIPRLGGLCCCFCVLFFQTCWAKFICGGAAFLAEEHQQYNPTDNW